MCSIIGKADKLEIMIQELADELEEVKEKEERLENKISGNDSETKDVLEELKKCISEQSERIKNVEEKFEATFLEQRKIIDDILGKVAEVDYNRNTNTIIACFHIFTVSIAGEIT